MEFIEYICNEVLNLNTLINLYNSLIKYFIPYLVIYLIVITVSFYKIFEKEKYKGWFIFIPFYNVYLIAKIVKVPLILFFIPVLNLIVLIVMPYNLAREYGCKEWERCLSIVIPFFYLPYIAFSNKIYKDHQSEYNYLKYYNDVDKLDDELKLYNNANIIEGEEEIPIRTKKEIYKASKQQEFLDSIDKKSDDIYVEDSEFEKYKDPVKEEIIENLNYDEELVDLEDEKAPESLEDINKLEQELNEGQNKDVNIDQNIQDYEKIGPSINAIAFGGKERLENQSEAKVEELKCKRCGTSLVGANGVCPGCGAKV